MKYEHSVLEQWITPDSRVLDLGCGDGSLLAFLKRSRSVHGCGIEIDPSLISDAIASGVDVLEKNIDDGLDVFGDNSFDTVVMTQTLQAIRYPDRALVEMLRVGREGIVTFPNFAHWRCRWHLNFHGRMPVSEFMPYSWYDTPNIHFCTVKDFEDLCTTLSIRILDREYRSEHNSFEPLVQGMPNLFASHAIYRISL